MKEKQNIAINPKSFLGIFETATESLFEGLAGQGIDIKALYDKAFSVLNSAEEALNFFDRFKVALATECVAKGLPIPKGAKGFDFFSFFTQPEILGAIVSVINGILGLFKGDKAVNSPFRGGMTEEQTAKVIIGLESIRAVIEANLIKPKQLKEIMTESVIDGMTGSSDSLAAPLRQAVSDLEFKITAEEKKENGI